MVEKFSEYINNIYKSRPNLRPRNELLLGIGGGVAVPVFGPTLVQNLERTRLLDNFERKSSIRRLTDFCHIFGAYIAVTKYFADVYELSALSSVRSENGEGFNLCDFAWEQDIVGNDRATDFPDLIYMLSYGDRNVQQGDQLESLLFRIKILDHSLREPYEKLARDFEFLG
jgi:hypothetical protein